MPLKPGESASWPEGVPHSVSGYEKPLHVLLDAAAEEFPEQTFTIFNDGRRSYSQVKDAADRVADFLRRRGIKPGERVALFLPNVPHFPEVFFGTLKAGAVCVTCNPLYTPAELRQQLLDSGASAIFCLDHPQLYPTTVEAQKGTEVNTVVICSVKSHLPKLKACIGGLLKKIPKADGHEPDHFHYEEVLAESRPEPPDVAVRPGRDPAVIMYTGGTTGTPKGACLTHANIVFDLLAMREWARAVQEPGGQSEPLRRGGYHCFLGVLPWYHSFGMTVVMLLSCHLAAKLVCIPDPKAGIPPYTGLLMSIKKHRCTILAAVPTLFAALANHAFVDRFDLSSLQICGSGGAPLPLEVARRFEEKTGAVLFEAYGLSESAPVITANPMSPEKRRFGTVGLPLPNTEIVIVDLESGQSELPRGVDGEIAVSGPQVMDGYWNKPEESAEVFRTIEGRRFFLTGDIGHIDPDGFLTITDRKKDLILVGGFNCYPREVEEVLYEHPTIAAAAVIGVPDEKSGEAVKAFVELLPGADTGEEEVLAFCRERLAGYKRPRSVEFRSQLPTSAVGKVLRRVLREEELERKSP